jgi:hypothetical protein
MHPRFPQIIPGAPVLWQFPATQVARVQRFGPAQSWSSRLAVCVQAPVPGSQAPLVHELPSSQETARCTHESLVPQESTVHGLPSSQERAVPRQTGAPLSSSAQASSREQASPSSQGVPNWLGRPAEQCPAASQTPPSVQPDGVSQEAPAGAG